jgi:hypothetical protein
LPREISSIGYPVAAHTQRSFKGAYAIWSSISAGIEKI